MTTPTPAARAAVLDALRLLAARDDLGGDEAFVGSMSARTELTPGQAGLCRRLLARHARHLPAEILGAAAEDGPDDPPPEPPARRRGRPRIGAEVLTPAERTRRRRSAGDLVALEVPAALAARFRSVRDARGESAAETLEAALDALGAGQAASAPSTRAEADEGRGGLSDG